MQGPRLWQWGHFRAAAQTLLPRVVQRGARPGGRGTDGLVQLADSAAPHSVCPFGETERERKTNTDEGGGGGCGC